MASVTFAVDEGLKTRMAKFSWVNWSEVARNDLQFRDELEKKLSSREEQDIVKWSVELARKARKGRHKQLLKKLGPARRKELGL